MNNNRLGCLSQTALLATLITVLVIAGVAMFSGSSFFSAGNLNAQAGTNIGGVNSHAAIGSDCAKCHPAPWDKDTLADRCMVCHADISRQLADPESMHGLMMKDPSLTCRTCHTDHNGAAAPLTAMAMGEFPHNFTGFSLASHARHDDGQAFTCSDCHNDDISQFNASACTDCHQEIDNAFLALHNQSYGADCLGCHDGVETYAKNYDHSLTAFKLDGKHREAVCEKCHLNARGAADFKNLPADCASCHLQDDAHEGAFGNDCGKCHNSSAWEPANFDHNLTAFKLDGKHALAECQDCHANNVFTNTPTDCYACHKQDDEHNGEYGQDCSVCHQTAAWEPATFDHNLSAFKLDGAHGNVACQDCHKDNVFKGTPVECSACHTDPEYHAGMFPNQACSDCHTTAAWRPATYNGKHTFPMDHGERNNTCDDCHQPTLAQWTCYTCHDQAEVVNKHREEGISNFDDCLRCHPTGREEGEN